MTESRESVLNRRREREDARHASAGYSTSRLGNEREGRRVGDIFQSRLLSVPSRFIRPFVRSGDSKSSRPKSGSNYSLWMYLARLPCLASISADMRARAQVAKSREDTRESHRQRE